MNCSRIISAAALAGCILLPSAAHAQLNSNRLGNSGYGIFGDGSNINGSYNGSASGNFNKNYSYNQSQIGNYATQAYSGSYIQPLSRYGLGANGSGNSVISPYLNLLRPGNTAVNYYGIVRPQVRQEAVNGDWATNFKQAERVGEEELRARQGLENNYQAFVDWSQAYKQAEFEGEKEARRRAGENPEPEFRDWATSYKDQELQGEAKVEKDRAKSKQRAANLRQAKELKELEGELAGNADPGRGVAQPSLASGLQSYHGPGYASQFKSMTHYYPSQGQPISRIGGR
jgi:hypothetical protein